jgi:hypothetical protein
MELAYSKIRTTSLFDPPIQHKAKAVIAALKPILDLLEGDVQPIDKRSEELERYFTEQFLDWEIYKTLAQECEEVGSAT